MKRLVVEGRPVGYGAAWVFGAFILAAAAATILGELHAIPWVRPGGACVGQLICVATFFFAWGMAYLVSRRAWARTGRVELLEAEVVFTRERREVRHAWADFVGYRDGDADFVELVRREGVPVPNGFWQLTIPTATDADRTAVLAFLDERGLRRLE